MVYFNSIQYAGLPVISNMWCADCATGGSTAQLGNCLIAGGSILTVVGSNFYGALTLPSVCRMGSVTLINATAATCILSNSTANSVVNVTGAALGGALLSGAVVRYADVPIVTALASAACAHGIGSLALANCSVANRNNSGSMLTVYGANFYGTVTVSAVACTSPVMVLNSTLLTCLLANGSSDSVVTLSISANGGNSSSYSNGTTSTAATIRYAAAPVITNLSLAACSNVDGSSMSLVDCPATNSIGQLLLTVIGSSFYGAVSTSNACVSGTVSMLSSTMLTCSFANGTASSTVIVQVSGNGGTSSVASGAAVSYAAPPAISGLFAAACAGSGTLQLTGCPLMFDFEAKQTETRTDVLAS